MSGPTQAQRSGSLGVADIVLPEVALRRRASPSGQAELRPGSARTIWYIRREISGFCRITL
jgi:hypothetical protein